MDKTRILIAHPEGNINNNPNISGIVEILCDEGYFVDIVSPKRRYPQFAPCKRSKIILFDDRITRYLSKIPFLEQFSITLSRIRMNQHKKDDYKLVIGVDRDGIIEASYISQLLGIPYGLISYEIFFRDETSARFKSKEVDACAHIDFAVCQDVVRSSLLAKENHIPLEKIINIPVAGRGVRMGEKTRDLHNRLNIPPDKKIALYMGSIANWTMIKELIQSVDNWPEEWVLVLHDRYGISSKVNKLIGGRHSESIFISNEIYPTPEDLSEILHSIDLGIALYKPTFDGIYTGKNLKYLGLSSGKIATYLQHGVPVLTNENGLISDYIREYETGYIIEDADDIPEVLKSINREGCDMKGSHILFEEKLDLNHHINPLIDKIESLMQNTNTTTRTSFYRHISRR